jgi:hypothetical protein
MSEKLNKCKHSVNDRILVIKPLISNGTWNRKDEYAKILGFTNAVEALGSDMFPTSFMFNKAFEEYEQLTLEQYKNNLTFKRAKKTYITRNSRLL